MAEIETNVQDRVINKSVPFSITIDNPTFWEKIKRKKIAYYEIKPQCLGSLMIISKLLKNVDIEELNNLKNEQIISKGFDFIINYKDVLLQVVAQIIYNSDKKAKKSLIRFLDRNLNAQELSSLVVISLQLLDVGFFLNSLKLVRSGVAIV